MTLYKYVAPTMYALEGLSRRQLIARHYAEFNDPFEFWARVYSGIPDRLKERARYLEAVATWGGDEEGEIAVPEFFENLAEGQPDFEFLYDTTRITCFASSNDNLLMWSHYADGLRGFCLGFDEQILTREENSYLATVRYSDAPPVVDSFVYAVAQDQVDYHQMALDEWRGPGEDPMADDYRRVEEESRALQVRIWESAFASKPLEWSYEGERRLLLRATEDGKAPIFLTYPPEAVQEIIVGERVTPEFRASLQEAIRAAGIVAPIKSASRARDFYKLNVS